VSAAGHGGEGAEGPDCIEMTEKEDFFLVLEASGARTKMGFENIAMIVLPVEFDAAAELLEVGGGEGCAGVDGGFGVGGGFGLDEFTGEIEKRRLFAAGSGEEGAHGNGHVEGNRHLRTLVEIVGHYRRERTARC